MLRAKLKLSLAEKEVKKEWGGGKAGRYCFMYKDLAR